MRKETRNGLIFIFLIIVLSFSGAGVMFGDKFSNGSGNWKKI
jgi:hypothetical protein